MTNNTAAQRIALKSLKVSKSLSDETTAFSANLYLDGKSLGHAENRGHGGETSFYPSEAAIKRLKSARAVYDALAEALDEKNGGEDFTTFCEFAIMRADFDKFTKRGGVVLIDDKSGNPLGDVIDADGNIIDVYRR